MSSGLQYRALGKSGLTVSDFCLGMLPMGPLQLDVPAADCIEIVRKAAELGVTFFDTAEGYRTQPYLGQALKEIGKKVVIATKSQAATYDLMAAAVEKSLKELQVDYIDIYHIHAPKPSIEVFADRSGAFECLTALKQQKVIGAVGIATHNPRVVKVAADRDDIDVIFALVNKAGLGISEGSTEDMLSSIAKASANGKGIYAMKALGGGNLAGDLEASINWVRGIKEVNAAAVGVVSLPELLMDLKVFGVSSPEIDSYDFDSNPIRGKRLMIIDFFCKGCGNCVETCPNEALFLENGKAKVDPEKCILCGYCAPECPEFAFRMI